MGISIRQMVLLLLVVSSVFVSLPYAKGGCSGSCSISGGASYDFLGDPGFNPDMSSFDEFMRDNLDDQSTLNTKSVSQNDTQTVNSSINQSIDDNSRKNGIAVSPSTNSSTNTTADKETIKLGSIGMQDKRASSMAFAAFNNKF